MSAYALPGLLFPPLPSCFDAYRYCDNGNTSINDGSSGRDAPNRIDADCLLSKSNPYSERFYNGDHEAPSSSSCKVNRQQHHETQLSASSISNAGVPNISIVDAKIDAIRLIKSLVSSSSSSSSSSQHHSSEKSKQRADDLYDECMIFTFRIDRSNYRDEKAKISSTTISKSLFQVLQLYSNMRQSEERTPNLLSLLNHNALHDNSHSQQYQPTFRNRSFSCLQDQIRIYRPIIEQWIRTVVSSFIQENQSPLLGIWDEFVTNPNHEQYHDNNDMRRLIHDDPIAITDNTTDNESFVSALTPIQRHSASTLYSSSRRHKQKVQPRRIVSMESIDEEEWE